MHKQRGKRVIRTRKRTENGNVYRFTQNNTKRISNWKTSGFEGIIFTNPSARVGCDTRSIFKRSLTGLNSEFSFS